MAEKNNSTSEIQLVVFDLASEHYGVDISDVREIIRMQDITRVPGAVSFVEGVINIRGKVLPVIDLRKRLNLKIADLSKESRIVIIDMSGGEVGVIVDAVSEVLRVPNSAIEPPATMMAHTDASYLQGIAKLDDRLIILLDVGKLMAGGINLEGLGNMAGNGSDQKKDDMNGKKNGQAAAKTRELSAIAK